jgi:predicted DNA-binding transcriptional regulator AlpA
MEQQSTPRVLVRYADLKALGVLYSRSTIWRLIAAGQFPAPIKFGAATAAFFRKVTNARSPPWLTNISYAEFASEKGVGIGGELHDALPYKLNGAHSTVGKRAGLHRKKQSYPAHQRGDLDVWGLYCCSGQTSS